MKNITDVLFVTNGSVAYLDYLSRRNEIAKIVIVCDCGVHSRVISKRCLSPDDPKNLRTITAKCPSCGQKLTIRLYVYIPLEIPSDRITKLDMETWKGLDVPIEIRCGCMGGSQQIRIPSIISGLMRCVSLCKECRNIVEALVDFK